MLFSLFLYSIRVILPFMAAFITYCCFRSLFGSLKPIRPLVVLFNKASGERIPILYWENSIGRSKHCDVVIDNPAVSRDHAVLFRRKEGWIISDTNSKAGVFLNGKRISEDAKVCIGDAITLGGTSFELCKSDVLETRNNPLSSFSNETTYSGAAILLWITLFQILAAFSFCFSPGKILYEPTAVIGFVLLLEWAVYFISKYVFHRNNFEIESIALFLSGIGIINLCTVDVKDAITQTTALVVGIVMFEVLVLLIKHADFSMKLRPYIAVFAILILIVNLVFGKVKNGAQNWIALGSYSIQPSEFVKIAFIFIGSSTLKGIQTAKNLTGFILFSAACMGALFLMGDFGTASIFFVTFILIAFMRSGSFRTLILTCSSAALGAGFILKFKPYIATRFSAWRHVWQYSDGVGFQQTRVLICAASGGLLGLGLGHGCLKNVFAGPSDLVFGMLCEEWGVIFSILVLLNIVLLAMYTKHEGVRCRSVFYTISSCCAAGMMAFQMIMNVFGVVDILPLTGVTLPFVSMGGSSLISVWALMAFIKASDDRTYSIA